MARRRINVPLLVTEKDIRKILDGALEWPPSLGNGAACSRLHDDHDGTFQGRVVVGFSPDGDAWIATDQPAGQALRYRTIAGGTNSPRVHNALVALALAMAMDEADRPDKKPGQK